MGGIPIYGDAGDGVEPIGIPPTVDQGQLILAMGGQRGIQFDDNTAVSPKKISYQSGTFLVTRGVTVLGLLFGIESDQLVKGLLRCATCL